MDLGDNLISAGFFRITACLSAKEFIFVDFLVFRYSNMNVSEGLPKSLSRMSERYASGE